MENSKGFAALERERKRARAKERERVFLVEILVG